MYDWLHNIAVYVMWKVECSGCGEARVYPTLYMYKMIEDVEYLKEAVSRL